MLVVNKVDSIAKGIPITDMIMRLGLFVVPHWSASVMSEANREKG